MVRWVSVAHRLNMLVLTDSKYWDVFGDQKGKSVVGGIELDKLGHLAVGMATPLTTDDPEQHRKLKNCCMSRNFGWHIVKHCLPSIYQSAQSSFSFAGGQAINMIEVIQQYVSRANSLALLAPPGSKAHQEIYPLLYNADKRPNPAWNPIPKAVESLGRSVNAEVLYSPSYLLGKVLDCLNAAATYGFGNGSDDYQSETEKQQQVLREAAETIIQASKRSLASSASSETVGRDFIQGQIEHMIASGGYTDEQLVDMVLLILVVGQRTTSVAIESCLRHLVIYPEWQQILHDEITSVLKDQPVTHETLNQNAMPNLHNFVWETLRLFPPVPVQARETTEALEIDSMQVPKGTTLLLAHYLVQRDPKKFANPDTFNPRRFESDACTTGQFQTFGRAPHNCAGKMLALTATIKAALVHLVLSYKLEAKDLESVKKTDEVGGFILSFSKPLELKLSQR